MPASAAARVAAAARLANVRERLAVRQVWELGQPPAARPAADATDAAEAPDAAEVAEAPDAAEVAEGT